MSFQWIIDNAENISINTKKVVASTTARDGTVRSVSRGGQVWRFDVKLPDGIPWTTLRQNIALAEALDRVTPADIQLNAAGHNWLVKYQGSYTNLTAYGGAIARATIVKGATSITLTTSGTLGSGYKFRAGDYIQLGSTGSVYTVAADVAYNSNTVTLNRPILDDSATGVYVLAAQYVKWNVICTSFPDWNLMARDQVSWSGTFTFVENLV